MDIDDVDDWLLAEKLFQKKQNNSMLFNQINKNEKKIAIYLNENNNVVYKDLIKKQIFFLKNIRRNL